MLSKKVDELAKMVKSEQSVKSEYKKSLMEQEEISSNLHSVLQFDFDRNYVLRDEGSSHRYLDKVRKTFYTLQGEANVAATKCSKVIEIVAKHTLYIEFKESLPSSSSALNFSNEGHISFLNTNVQVKFYNISILLLHVMWLVAKTPVTWSSILFSLMVRICQ